MSLIIVFANRLPRQFNAREYFAGIYGPRVYPDMKAETVVLKVSGMQVKYFKSLPPTSMTYFLSIFNASKTSVFYKNQK